jgi:hypothetical protein
MPSDSNEDLNPVLGRPDLSPAARFMHYLLPMASNKDIPKRMGRPATGRDPMITFRSPPEITAALQAATSDHPDQSRSELIRQIVAEWLRKRRYLTSK